MKTNLSLKHRKKPVYSTSVIVGSSCDNAVPNCGVIGDASSCNATTGCTWQAFPTSQCILDCAQYTSQTNCQSAFDGACQWNAMFGSCAPAPKNSVCCKMSCCCCAPEYQDIFTYTYTSPDDCRRPENIAGGYNYEVVDSSFCESGM